MNIPSLSKDRSYKLSFFCALILHVIIGVALCVQLASINKHPAMQANVNIVQAFSVNQREVETTLAQAAEARRQAALALLQQQREQREQQQREQQKQVEKQTAAQQRAAEAAEAETKQREAQQKKVEVALKKRVLEEQMQKELQTINQEIQAQKKVLAAAQKQQEKKSLQSTLEKELAREEKLLQQKGEQLRKVSDEHASEAAKDAAEESEAANVAGKDSEKTGAYSASQAKEINKYAAMIEHAISQEWIVPDGDDEKDSCRLLITIGPGGVVLNVKVVQPAANPLLERSAQNAVWKASPLPVPQDAALFDHFRTINLTVPSGTRRLGLRMEG